MLKDMKTQSHLKPGQKGIRHLAVQRKISGTFFKKAVPKYLLLLGIAQTCRFQGKSFLKFLLSEEIDIDRFKATKHIKKSFMVGLSSEKPKVAVPNMRQIDT
ncbi:MAG TPA: hypothetical protein HPP94_17025 [Desulfuromonadales bacterium]|nr:hypothetical protein [Desulfuromonadales bacterium]